MSIITDEMVEAGARAMFEAELGRPFETGPKFERAHVRAASRAAILAAAPLIRAAALEEAANAADAAVEHCRISAERAEAHGSKLGALLSAYGQECIQAIASAIRDHTKSDKALCFEADKITELRAELLFADSLSERQAALLTEVVNALRGDPPSGVHWSHHDAGELAKAAADEIERLRRKADEVRNAVIALMEWVWPIAGDNQNPHEACIELNTAERVRELLGLADDTEDDGQPSELQEWRDYDRDC